MGVPFFRFPFLVQRHIMDQLAAMEIYNMARAHRQIMRFTKRFTVSNICVTMKENYEVAFTMRSFFVEACAVRLSEKTPKEMIRAINVLLAAFKNEGPMGRLHLASENPQHSYEVLQHTKRLGLKSNSSHWSGKLADGGMINNVLDIISDSPTSIVFEGHSDDVTVYDGFHKFRAETLIIRNGFWLTLTNVLDLTNCYSVSLNFDSNESCPFTTQDLNAIVRRWIDDPFEQKVFKIHGRYNVNPDEVLNGIQFSRSSFAPGAYTVERFDKKRVIVTILGFFLLTLAF